MSQNQPPGGPPQKAFKGTAIMEGFEIPPYVPGGAPPADVSGTLVSQGQPGFAPAGAPNPVAVVPPAGAPPAEAPPGFGAPPGAPPGFGAPPPGAPPGFGAPPGAPPGFGAPPDAPPPGYGAPPGFGAPPDAPPPGYGAPPGGAPPGYGAPPGGAPPMGAPPGGGFAPPGGGFAPPGGGYAPPGGAMQPAGMGMNAYPPEDIEQGKMWALLGYVISPVWIIPLITRDNAFSMFHAKQALVFNIIAVVVSVVLSIIVVPTSFFTCGLSAVLYLGMFAFIYPWAMGLMAAIQGKYEPMPWFGQYADQWLGGFQADKRPGGQPPR